MSKYANNAIETVRLSEEGKHKLIEGINDQAANVDVPFERRNIRVDYVNPKLPVLIVQPGGQAVTYVAVARNLSRWGIAYILGQLVYPDAQCAIILSDLDGKARQIGGRVVRCRHVSGIMHEISVLFQEPLDLDTFIASAKGTLQR